MTKNLLELKYKSVLYIDTDSIERTQNVAMLRTLFKKTIVTDNNKKALALYKEKSPDLIITAIEESKTDGIKFIHKLRQNDYFIPLIVLSEPLEYNTLLEITNLSIDAYLNKPLHMEQFKRSICQSIKRNSETQEMLVLEENLIFNFATKELSLNNSVITLGVKEMQLLSLLIKNRSQTVTTEEIEKELWNMDSVSDSAIKKLVFRIRKKLDTDIIVAEKGVGYRLDIKETKTTQQLLQSA